LPRQLPAPSPSNDYEKEFVALSSALPTRISTLVNYESNEDKGKSEVRSIKTEIATAKQLLSDMEMSNRTIGEPTKRELGKKISMHRETMKTLEKDLGQAEQKFDRSALFGARGAAGGPLEYDKSQSARDRAVAATEKLKSGTGVLDDAHRRLEETIDVGADTLGQLESNREKMLRIRGNVRAFALWGPRGRGGRGRGGRLFLFSLSHAPTTFSHRLAYRLTGGGGVGRSRHGAAHPAGHEPTRDSEQGRGGRVCCGHDRHHCAAHLVDQQAQIKSGLQ
jgi:hypothetical protein